MGQQRGKEKWNKYVEPQRDLYDKHCNTKFYTLKIGSV